MTRRDLPFDAPEDVARAVRQAFVPYYVRTLFRHLPQRISLAVRVPPRQPLPPAALQFLKLAVLAGSLECQVVDLAHGGEAELVLSLGERRVRFGPEALGGEARTLCDQALPVLLDARDLTRALEAFALRSAKLAALQELTSHMLRAESMEQVHHVMLSGITSGQGLAFHRAALFVYDEKSGTFRGVKGIGPSDEKEAHRIWEAIEYEDKTIGEMLSEQARSSVVTRFDDLVRHMELVPGPSPDDELSLALSYPTPYVVRRRPLINETLHPLVPGREFVLTAVRPHGATRALLFADDRFASPQTGDGAISETRLSFLGFFIGQMALVWENLSLLQRVEELARIDGLTGVNTRRAFEERFVEEKSRAMRDKSPCSVLVVDVDHFKAVNDERGHAEGDAVLRNLGGVLRQQLRTHDVVGRMGGDEFVVLLPGSSLEDAMVVGRRIGAAAKASGVSLSLGAATWPDDVEDAMALLQVADQRLYAAKRAGRGRACWGDDKFTPF